MSSAGGNWGVAPISWRPILSPCMTCARPSVPCQHPRCHFGANVVNYYHYCLENDLFLTHALGDPQVDRSQQPQNEQRATQERR